MLTSTKISLKKNPNKHESWKRSLRLLNICSGGDAPREKRCILRVHRTPDIALTSSGQMSGLLTQHSSSPTSFKRHGMFYQTQRESQNMPREWSISHLFQKVVLWNVHCCEGYPWDIAESTICQSLQVSYWKAFSPPGHLIYRSTLILSELSIK